jgi:anti-anti-sigma regulatory factor
MSNCNGKVFARRVGDEVCFLVIGRANAHLSPALRQYAEDALASGATKVQIHLCDCTHCDSTFLGTLLRLRQVAGGDGSRSVQLVRPSAEVRQILAQMGAARLFDMVDRAPAANSDVTWQDLPDDEGLTSAARFKRNVVEAHQALAAAGGELTQRFGAVAESLQQEWAAAERQ